MYLEQQKKLAKHVRAFLREKYHVDLANIVIDQPPNVEMGEFALPLILRTGQAAAQSSAQDCRRDCRRACPCPMDSRSWKSPALATSMRG